MSRTRLPNRRPSDLIRFDHWQMQYEGSFSCFEDGRPAEVFLQCGKSGTSIEAVARDAAVVASIALQRGATLQELRDSITRDADGMAAGPLGALLDLIQEQTEAERAAASIETPRGADDPAQ